MINAQGGGVSEVGGIGYNEDDEVSYSEFLLGTLLFATKLEKSPTVARVYQVLTQKPQVHDTRTEQRHSAYHPPYLTS